MSTKYPGGIISKTAPTPSGPYSTDTAPGVWTLEQQAYWQKLGQWPTAGNVNPSAFIENLFSTYLYTGTGAAQTITNGIDLSTNGGLVWIKSRSTTYNNYLQDTTRGIQNTLVSNDTSAQSVGNDIVDSVSTSGFVASLYNGGNASGQTYASWTFREQAKFFDVVTYSGSNSNQTINHNLGSAPGCIIIKNTTGTAGWAVYHRSLTNPNQYRLFLNTTAAEDNYGANFIYNVTSTSFDVAGGSGFINISGSSFVAYVFAHDAGGFGTSGLENVISCGSWSTTLVDGRYDAVIDLGYEPQWVMFKPTNNTGSWQIYDNMRGWTSNSAGSNVSQRLYPNLTNAEDTDTNTQIQYDGIGKIKLAVGASGYSGIYIAIRRGPMATPTVGTSVFAPVTTFNASAPYVTTGFPVDMAMRKWKAGSESTRIVDRLRGTTSTTGNILETASTAAEASNSSSIWALDYSTGMAAATSTNTVYECFRRAPSFFDEVCYTGTGVDGATFSHNLTVAPELMIVKLRSAATDNWFVYSAALGATKALYLNTTNAAVTSAGFWNDTAPTSSVFSTYSAFTNQSGQTYVAYLFATCPEVSKVGSYTGTGTTAQIDCGFTTGARFVLIKRTDSTGDWYVWDSARGIVAGNDPYLLLNSTAAEVTSTDYVDTYSAGFEISSTAPSAINANGGTFIFLAIA